MSRFEHPDFLEWTDGVFVNINDFHNTLIKKFGVPVYDINADVYDKEYNEYLWKKFERDTLFDSWDEMMKFVETVLHDEYISGTPIYAFQKGNEDDGYMYQVSLDYNNRLPGFEDVEL